MLSVLNIFSDYKMITTVILKIKTLEFISVNYEEENWNTLIGQLHNDWKKNTRAQPGAQLIDDAFNLAKAKKWFIHWFWDSQSIKYKIKTTYI